MGGGKSKSSQSTANTQTTNNTDNSINTGSGASVFQATGNAKITINDLSADVAGAALDLGADAVGGAFELSKYTTDRAFDSFDASSKLLNDYATAQSTDLKYQALKNQELTASLAAKSFDLANEKTQSADDKVFSFGRVALYILGGLAALFLLPKLFKSSKE